MWDTRHIYYAHIKHIYQTSTTWATWSPLFLGLLLLSPLLKCCTNAGFNFSPWLYPKTFLVAAASFCLLLSYLGEQPVTRGHCIGHFSVILPMNRLNSGLSSFSNPGINSGLFSVRFVLIMFKLMLKFFLRSGSSSVLILCMNNVLGFNRCQSTLSNLYHPLQYPLVPAGVPAPHQWMSDLTDFTADAAVRKPEVTTQMKSLSFEWLWTWKGSRLSFYCDVTQVKPAGVDLGQIKRRTRWPDDVMMKQEVRDGVSGQSVRTLRTHLTSERPPEIEGG